MKLQVVQHSSSLLWIVSAIVVWWNTNNHNVFVEASTTSAGASAAVNTLAALDYRYFLAGGTCAAISHGITTPVDVVKTRIQADPEKYDKGLYSSAVSICKTEGPQVLLAGLGPTVVGYGIEGAMKFGVYEVLKPIFTNILLTMKQKTKGGGATSSSTSTSNVAFLFASIVAGAVAALLLCPMESTRIRIVTDPEYSHLGLLLGFPKLVREEGFFSTFAGIWAMLAKQVPYTFGKQVSFDVFAAILYGFFEANQDRIQLRSNMIKSIVSVTAAFIASIVACIFSQPGDMILTETYRREEEEQQSPSKKQQRPRPRRKQQSQQKQQSLSKQQQQKNFLQIIDTIYNRGGIRYFFTGTGARIVHVGLIITSQLVIYDIVKQMLGLPATGSH